jgi:hypothetical protein
MALVMIGTLLMEVVKMALEAHLSIAEIGALPKRSLRYALRKYSGNY